MNLILLGAPGTGKGTQAHSLSQRYGWSHISTGDMLREEVASGTELGATAKKFMDAGELVTDEVVIDMLTDRLRRDDGKQGVVLDGFPRNLAQAIALDKAFAESGQSIDRVLNIVVPEDELIRRLSGRWLCRNCSAIYHESTNPPAVAEKCDNCGGQLYQRDDDRPETVRARLDRQKTPADLLAHYRDTGKLVDINGEQSVEDVTNDLLAAVQSADVKTE